MYIKMKKRWYYYKGTNNESTELNQTILIRIVESTHRNISEIFWTRAESGLYRARTQLHRHGRFRQRFRLHAPTSTPLPDTSAGRARYLRGNSAHGGAGYIHEAAATFYEDRQ